MSVTVPAEERKADTVLSRACSLYPPGCLPAIAGVEVSVQVPFSSSSFSSQEPRLEALKEGGGAAVAATSAPELLALSSI